ncbi:kinase-like domain-containing protein [Glomus cerebriforme]|uniref:Kinase-like domain-containing protein n=1 Tax=Glomus cerebriforme TaxID=658196 RepID=A0A397TGT1_9GLOM|nr:kinase-like domain-containing protein [Glomus cerebriforme]
MISDLGLCGPARFIAKNDVHGVLPYIAPEVLRGKSYTRAADIYSFGIIMWEMTSGIPAFHNISHDFQLSLDICKGIRPEIIEGTMPEYVELMKRCWDNDPEKRPRVYELEEIFFEWIKCYPIEDGKKRISVPEDEPEFIYHPKSCYTSRKINYSNKLNGILDGLSDIIVIMSDNDGNNNGYDYETMMSEDLEHCAIKN